MVQLNLLPDIKLEYIKAARVKRTVIISSVLISVAVIVLLAFISAYTYIIRSGHLSNLSEDVSSRISNLESTEDIDKILTVQNQLASLPELHDSKPKLSSLFEYLSQLTPTGVNLNELELSVVDGTIKISGEADTLATVNAFVDTIKLTDFEVAQSVTEDQELSDKKRAFSEVVLDSFSFNEGKIPYSVSFKFAPEIFSNTLDVKLIVPNRFSTRSELEKPLFEAPTIIKEGEE